MISLSAFREDKRNPVIDFLKAIAMVMVIFSHCILRFVDSGLTGPFSNFLWLAQMPLFMFAAGMVGFTEEKNNTLAKYGYKVLRHTITLLFPCLTYLLISSAIAQRNPLLSFVDFYHDPQTNLWFLWVLWMIRIVFDFFHYLSTKMRRRARWILPVIVMAIISLVITGIIIISRGSFTGKTLGLNLAAYYSVFFCLGYLVINVIKKWSPIPKWVKICAYVLLGVAILYVVFLICRFHSIHAFDDGNIGYLILRITGSMSTIYVCVSLSLLLARFRWFRFIANGGKYSLQAYYLHVIYLGFLSFGAENVALQWCIAFGATILLSLMVAATLLLMYQIPYLHLLIFGKSFSRYAFEKRLPRLFR